jgi:hypothetical protein
LDQYILTELKDVVDFCRKAYNEYLELKKNNLWGSHKYF